MNSEIKPIVKVLFGSHLYGLETELSDIDYKAIYIPTPDDILLSKIKPTYNYSTNIKNLPNEEDYEIYSLDKFIKMAKSGETVAMDMLHAENILDDSPIWDFLVANRTMFYSKNMNSFLGYLKKQFMKYGLKGSKLIELDTLIECLSDIDLNLPIIGNEGLLPIGEFTKWKHLENKGTHEMEYFYLVNDKHIQANLKLLDIYNAASKSIKVYGARAQAAKLNNGSDWKAISHALRVAQQLLEIHLYGDYSYPLINNEYILSVKMGEVDYDVVVQSFDKILNDINEAAKHSKLPETPDTSQWDEYICNIYNDVVLSGDRNISGEALSTDKIFNLVDLIEFFDGNSDNLNKLREGVYINAEIMNDLFLSDMQSNITINGKQHKIQVLYVQDGVYLANLHMR